MVKRNPNFGKLASSYLFVEIRNRKEAFMAANPDAKLIALGIGDTTEPLPAVIVEAVKAKADAMGTREGYQGYPEPYGEDDIRKHIAKEIYKDAVSFDEIFVSDGSKPDLARFQFLSAAGSKIAVQDPVYPAYVDQSVIGGKTGENKEGRYENIVYMDCNPANNFFPDLSILDSSVDYIFFCSPANPSGAVATKDQLAALIAKAKEIGAFIVFDGAYSAFIQDDSLPKSIYEVPGAREVAFETNSFSKNLGFTGVRLGWTVCPKDLKFEDGALVHADWSRVVGTMSNGPSHFASAGACAMFTEAGMKAHKELIQYYLGNAKLVREVLLKANMEVYGGDNAPYVWVRCPGKDSWSTFQEFLDKCQIVSTPGAGFGSMGEGFVRFSSFAPRAAVEEAVTRLAKHYGV